MPQWSPALTAGKSSAGTRRTGGGQARRNGARPSRPGRADEPCRSGVGDAAAAMEPGPHGREEAGLGAPVRSASGPPQWSPALTAGKSRRAHGLRSACDRRPQWSPALTAGKSVALVTKDGWIVEAAMEPGPHGREERQARGVVGGGRGAAMEPGPHGREETPDDISCNMSSPWPQWSPALTAGKRSPHLHHRGALLQAAMEPGPHGREERLGQQAAQGAQRQAAMEPGPHGREERPGGGRVGGQAGQAAMEPGPHGREEESNLPIVGTECHAAMEPGPHGREEGSEVVHGHPRHAAAMEPGPHGREEEARLPRAWSGISPAAMEPGPHGREEFGDHQPHRWQERAAMEPGPHGREEVCASSTNQRGRTEPQWSPALTAGKRSAASPRRGRSCTRRNGARPSRPGRGRSSPTRSVPGRRNGARPSRPGRGHASYSPSRAGFCRNGARPSRPGRARTTRPTPGRQP